MSQTRSQYQDHARMKTPMPDAAAPLAPSAATFRAVQAGPSIRIPDRHHKEVP